MARQTESFGRFNALIREYSFVMQELITNCADRMGLHLLRVADPQMSFYDEQAYIESIVDGYRGLARLVRK